MDISGSDRCLHLELRSANLISSVLLRGDLMDDRLSACGAPRAANAGLEKPRI